MSDDEQRFPPPLAGLSALDAAARIRIDPYDHHYAEQLARHLDVTARPARVEPRQEMRNAEASAMAHLQAARRFYDDLYATCSADERADAWQRARELDEHVIRYALHHYRYPGHEHDVVPDTEEICPGFAHETYEWALTRALFSMR